MAVVAVDWGDLAEAVCSLPRRYEKYDAPIKTRSNKSDDPFMEIYNEVEAELEKLLDVGNIPP